MDKKEDDSYNIFYLTAGSQAYESKSAEAKARLDAHNEEELKATRLETAKAARGTGKPSVITFVKIAASGEEDSRTID